MPPLVPSCARACATACALSECEDAERPWIYIIILFIVPPAANLENFYLTQGEFNLTQALTGYPFDENQRSIRQSNGLVETLRMSVEKAKSGFPPDSLILSDSATNVNLFV